MSCIHGVLSTDNLALSQNTHLPPQFLSGKGMFNHPRDPKNGKPFPNLDGIVEPEPRCVVGEGVEIDRSGEIVDGFSTWTAIRRSGVTEVMVSGVGGDDAAAILGTIDARVQAAYLGGTDA